MSFPFSIHMCGSNASGLSKVIALRNDVCLDMLLLYIISFLKSSGSLHLSGREGGAFEWHMTVYLPVCSVWLF